MIDNTGEPVEVPLQLAGRLRLELFATADTFEPPSLRILDAAGLPVTNSIGQVDRRLNRERDGPYYVNATMVPGTYRFEITGPDGSSWSDEFEIVAMDITEIVLR